MRFDGAENSAMTEEEASRVFVTKEMSRAGYIAYVNAAEQAGCRAGDDPWDEGIKAAFPTMFEVWLRQGSPVKFAPE